MADRPRVKLYLDRHDIWVGLYWTRKQYVISSELVLYICLLPFVVVRVTMPERYELSLAKREAEARGLHPDDLRSARGR